MNSEIFEVLKDIGRRYVASLPCPDTYRLGVEFDFDVQASVCRVIVDAYPTVLCKSLVEDDAPVFKHERSCCMVSRIVKGRDEREFENNFNNAVRWCAHDLMPHVIEMDKKFGDQLRALQAEVEATA